jgi:hypothetical protein
LKTIKTLKWVDKKTVICGSGAGIRLFLLADAERVSIFEDFAGLFRKIELSRNTVYSYLAIFAQFSYF